MRQLRAQRVGCREGIEYLSIMGIAAALLFLGNRVNAREREQDAETLDKGGDAYHVRRESNAWAGGLAADEIGRTRRKYEFALV